MVTNIDLDAVAALQQQRIGWQHKGLPSDAWGLTFEQFCAQRRDLVTGGFSGPLLTLDQAALNQNLSVFADWCRRQQVSLAPHGKTTMAPQLFAAQLESGAWGMTAATIAQARVYRAFGVATIMIANEVVDEAGLAWLATELANDPGCRILFWADSLLGVQVAQAAMSRLPGAQVAEVLVELGANNGRSGCRSVEQAMVVARAVASSPALRLAGVAGYEGILGASAELGVVDVVDTFLRQLGLLASCMQDEGLLDGLDEVILSAGGSVYFDRVAKVLGDVTLDPPVRVVLRSGCYLTHDDGLYKSLTPSSRGVTTAPRLAPALQIWAQVTSQPEPGLALMTMGRRDVAYDSGLPIPKAVRRRGTSSVQRLPGAEVFALNDQHAYLRFSESFPVAVGDWVACGISHPCSMFDRWRVIPLVDDVTVVGLVQTFF